jgi:hypothetical protein
VTEAKQVERAPGPRTILTTDALGTLPVPQLSPDLVAVKQALQLVQQHKLSDATRLAASIDDPARSNREQSKPLILATAGKNRGA